MSGAPIAPRPLYGRRSRRRPTGRGSGRDGAGSHLSQSLDLRHSFYCTTLEQKRTGWCSTGSAGRQAYGYGAGDSDASIFLLNRSYGAEEAVTAADYLDVMAPLPTVKAKVSTGEEDARRIEALRQGAMMTAARARNDGRHQGRARRRQAFRGWLMIRQLSTAFLAGAALFAASPALAQTCFGVEARVNAATGVLTGTVTTEVTTTEAALIAAELLQRARLLSAIKVMTAQQSASADQNVTMGVKTAEANASALTAQKVRQAVAEAKHRYGSIGYDPCGAATKSAGLSSAVAVAATQAKTTRESVRARPGAYGDPAPWFQAARDGSVADGGALYSGDQAAAKNTSTLWWARPTSTSPRSGARPKGMPPSSPRPAGTPIARSPPPCSPTWPPTMPRTDRSRRGASSRSTGSAMTVALPGQPASPRITSGAFCRTRSGSKLPI